MRAMKGIKDNELLNKKYIFIFSCLFLVFHQWNVEQTFLSFIWSFLKLSKRTIYENDVFL